MAKNILVATPQPAFGELLRLSLEECGRYRVRLVQTGREALSSAEHIVFSLVILDSALVGPPFSYVAQGLRSRWPDLRLLVIPPPAGRASSDLDAVPHDGSVDQPFYAPSLLELIDKLTAETDPASALPEQLNEKVAPVSQDGYAAAQSRILVDFLSDSSAPAVMVLKSHQPKVWAGQLRAEALNEVCGLLGRYIDAREGVDLARFVHLNSDGGEYLIYATPLLADEVLVMVYLVATPLTVIRNQAGRLARLLREPQPIPAAPPPDPFQEIDPTDDPETDDARLEADAMRLVDLLTEMPVPDPAVKSSGGDWVHEVPEKNNEKDAFVFPWERENEANASAATQAILARPSQVPAPQPAVSPEEVFELAETDLDSAGELSETPMNDVTQAVLTRPADATIPVLHGNHQRPASSIEDTRPVVLRTLQTIQQVEPMGSSLSHLAYTCVLIPRLPTHALLDVLAARLEEWLPQLCLAYGWRMEGLLIRPEYLQWTVQVAPAISPGNVIRLIRQQSSRRIFMTFPQYEVENPSGDFWAPGFLIISGFQPPSLQLVLDFIHQTRTRQSPWLH